MEVNVRFRCLQGPLKGEIIEIPASDRIVIGREEAEGHAASIVLPSKTVSRVHAELIHDEGQWKIKDMGSYNGIRVNKEKVIEKELKDGDFLEFGEFTLLFEEENLERTETTGKPITQKDYTTQQSKASKVQRKPLKDWQEKFKRVDFKYKLFGALILGGIVAHWMIYTPIFSRAKERAFHHSFENAKQLTANLSQRNENELANDTSYLLDCDFRLHPGVVHAQILNLKGEVLCPVGDKRTPDSMVKSAVEQDAEVNNCSENFNFSADRYCSIIRPVRAYRENEVQPQRVGYARLDFRPEDAQRSLQKMRKVGWTTFFLVLLVMGALGFVIRRWVILGVENVSGQVHLAYTGTTQEVEKIESFAALDSLVEAINRLVSKSNQGVSPDSGGAQAEASFLQILLEQVFLLEERPIMAVNSENHIIGASVYLEEVIPLQEGYINTHVSEAISDTHLQEELMTFLNDLSMGSEVLDRGLSLADRVIQARGMPLFFNEEHVATLVIF